MAAASYKSLPPLRAVSAGLLCALAVLAIAGLPPQARADRSKQTLSFLVCNEKEPPFDSSTCNFYTQLLADVDLIGGGSSVQLLSVVGDNSSPTINLADYPDGGTTCPPGFACRDLVPDETTIEVIRSPLPAGVPVVLPGADVSIGFYWKLTRSNNNSPDDRLPYAYAITELNVGTAPAPTKSYCEDSSIGPPVGAFFVTNNARSDQSAAQNPVEPVCGTDKVYAPGDAVDLRGTCGPLVPEPTFPDAMITDQDGLCTELCCRNSALPPSMRTKSVRVRPLGPLCYRFEASGPPKIAVDFAVQISNPSIGPDPITVPVYGLSDPGTVFVDDAGVRVRISALVGDLARFDNARAFAIEQGAVVICTNDTTTDATGRVVPNFPNEVNGPVASVEDIEWFYVPQTYLPFYKDATAAEAAQIERPNSPAETGHKKIYGASGSVIEDAAANYINSLPITPTEKYDLCDTLEGIKPFVPGYDTDEPLLPIAPYELPSYCYMWNAARSGNTGFLAPAFDVSAPNWFIRRGIPTTSQAAAEYDPNDLYLIFLPTLEQIEQANAEKSLENAITLSIEVNDNLMAYEAEATTLVLIADGSDGNAGAGNDSQPVTPPKPAPAPTCTMPSPGDVSSSAPAGTGKLWFTIRSGLTSSTTAGTAALPYAVTVTCIGQPSAGSSGKTPAVTVEPAGRVEYPALTESYSSRAFTYNVTASFGSTTYEKEAVQKSTLANCIIRVDSSTGAVNMSGEVPCAVLTCPVGSSCDENKKKNDAKNCTGFCATECRYDNKELYKDGCFWIYVIVVILVLVIVSVSIWFGVKSARENDAYESGLRGQNDSYVKSQIKSIRREHEARIAAARIGRGASKPGGAAMRRRFVHGGENPPSGYISVPQNVPT